MNIDAAALRSRLRHVYWIGGGSGGGKSTIAARLAEQRGLHLYSTDDAMRDHGQRVTSENAPHLRAFGAMDMDERWVNRSPEVMLETFHWFRGEGFHLIVEDLLALPEQPSVVVEGFRLLPRLLHPLLERPNQAVWLIPTPEFRRAAFESRGTLWGIPNKTHDPERALHNLLVRDGMFTERLERECEQAGLPLIRVDTSVTEDELYRRVEAQFDLGGG